MQACKSCGQYRDAETEDLKTHIQLSVPLRLESKYLSYGYTVVSKDEHMVTVRKSLYPEPPEPPPIRKLNF